MKTAECDLIASSLTGSRIVFVFNGSELGGAERQGLLLAAGLKDMYGAEVSVVGLSAKQPGRVARECRKYDIPWKPLDFYWPWDRWGSTRSLLYLAQSLRAMKPDIILPYISQPNLLCSLVWRLTGAKLCIWNQRDEGRGLDRRLWHRLAVNMASCLVSNSIVGKDFLEYQYKLKFNTVYLVPNALAPLQPKYDRVSWRTNNGLSATVFLATMIASFHQYKDHITLLKAWKTFLEGKLEMGEVPILMLVGRFDGTELEVRDTVIANGLQESVRLMGEIEDIADLLSATDLYLHSSRFEGTPNSILEAMSMSLPVVATDIPGIRETVGSIGESFLTPIADSQRMAELIDHFFTDKEFRIRVGKQLCSRVFENHDVHYMIDSMATIISNSLYRLS